MDNSDFRNPFRPGAGHMPPHLAGRQAEIRDFERLITQHEVILENLVLTGLRGTGKTVLLEKLKPIGISSGWRWVGTDLSESSSISEERLALRLLTDLAVTTSSIVVGQDEVPSFGFGRQPAVEHRYLDFATLSGIYAAQPGLVLDKLKAVIQFTWECIKELDDRGIIFAYDEAQNLADHAADREYPLSLLLDLFQSIQKQGIPFMLVLVGLPTLFPKLVDARTFAERMFHVVFLDRLTREESRDAIVTPLSDAHCPERLMLDETSVEMIIDEAAGYPYFLQFICREVYDAFLQQAPGRLAPMAAPISQVTRKLDADFFAGRWARATDRQRELLIVVANLDVEDGEFSIQDVVAHSKQLSSSKTIEKSFSSSHVNQMFNKLSELGLIYKNRHGKYSFAVPLLGRYIQRQMAELAEPDVHQPLL